MSRQAVLTERTTDAFISEAVSFQTHRNQPETLILRHLPNKTQNQNSNKNVNTYILLTNRELLIVTYDFPGVSEFFLVFKLRAVLMPKPVSP